jgi:protein-disulfide isomerase
MRVLLASIASTAVSAALLVAPLAGAQEFTPEQEADIGRIVREYLIANPEVLEEAVIALQDKRDADQAEASQAAIAARRDQIFNDARDFSIGPADAPIQIVEFFDYNCSFCRASAPWVKETLERYPDQVRFIFKETPIFADRSESSAQGARAAVAAIGQDRYLEFYFAMMEQSGTIPLSQVRRIAEESGINWREAQEIMESPETTQHLEDSLNLLDAIGATGTPAFVFNDQLVPGGANTELLDILIASALGEPPVEEESAGE